MQDRNHVKATAVLIYSDQHLQVTNMPETTILIVEDNPADRLLIKEYLAEEQLQAFNLLEAESLQAALDLLPHHDFDAILLDLQLPDSSGLDTVRKIVGEVPETAVIVLTGLQDEDTALQSVRYGAQDYLEKLHLSPATLSKSLRYSLERKKGLQDKEDLLHDLNHALKRIAQLESLLPMCIGCKKIHGEDKSWHTLEEFIHRGKPGATNERLCPVCQAALSEH